MGQESGLLMVAAIVFLLLLFVVLSGLTDFRAVQRAGLGQRLGYVSHVNAYICLISFVFYLADAFVLMTGVMSHEDTNKLKFFEYLLTCPLMQLCFVLLGGERVTEQRRMHAVTFPVCLLGFGFAAPQSDAERCKMAPNRCRTQQNGPKSMQNAAK